MAFSAVPTKCIVLLENIDSAGIGREKSQENKEQKNAAKSAASIATTFPGVHPVDLDDHYPRPPVMSKIKLSGLFNALYGASASEGLVVIMTSNHPEVLDSALTRPGRVDQRI